MPLLVDLAIAVLRRMVVAEEGATTVGDVGCTGGRMTMKLTEQTRRARRLLSRRGPRRNVRERPHWCSQDTTGMISQDAPGRASKPTLSRLVKTVVRDWSVWRLRIG